MIHIFEDQENDLFEKKIMIAVKQFDLYSSIMESTESDNGCINRLIAFLKSILDTLKKYLNKAIDVIKKYNDSADTRKMIQFIMQNASRMEQNGEKVEFYDVFKYSTTYQKFSIELNRAIDDVFSKENWKNEMTASKAESLIKKTDSIIKKYDTELEKIKTKKVQLSPTRLALWIKENINPKTATATGTLKKYIDHVEAGMKQMEQLRKDLDDYGDRTGYTVNASCVRDHVNNSILYMKRNADWLSGYAVSGAIALLNKGIKEVAIAKDIGKDKLSNNDYLGSDNHREDKKSAEDRYKNNPRAKAVKTVLNAGSTASLIKAEKDRVEAKKSGRNSIYNK